MAVPRFTALFAAIALLWAAVPVNGVVAQQAGDEKKSDAPLPQAVVGVIDFQRVVKESAAGRSVRDQMNQRRTKLQEEIKAIRQELETARAALATREPGLSEAEFSAKRQAMRKRVGELQGIMQSRQREMDAMFNYGMGQIDIALIAILKELAEERGINLILNAGRGRGLVLFAEKRIVITDEALRRLNARLPTVELSAAESAK